MKDYFYYNELKLKTHYLYVPYYNSNRRIRVLLPRDYHREKHKHYPVIYMHDGQNVFYSKESYSGYSWKVIPLLKKESASKVIIVGIDHAENDRLDEYGPWVFDDKSYGGKGELYSDWLVHDVKGFIDSKYRTLKDRKHTMLAGSSMGAIISAYIGSKYPEVFGRLGIFSLASWLSEAKFLSYIENNPISPDTKVYILAGTHEGNHTDNMFTNKNVNQLYINSSLNYYRALIKGGSHVDNLWLQILFGADHSEVFWANHFKQFLDFSL